MMMGEQGRWLIGRYYYYLMTGEEEQCLNNEDNGTLKQGCIISQ